MWESQATNVIWLNKKLPISTEQMLAYTIVLPVQQ